MANICEFVMKLKGNYEDIQEFYNELVGDSDVRIGICADSAELCFINENTAFIFNGCCRWSIGNTFFRKATKYIVQFENKVVDLFEACKNNNVNMIAYSKETGRCFQEMYRYENGRDYFDSTEYVESFDSTKELPYPKQGGYDDWDFYLNDVE